MEIIAKVRYEKQREIGGAAGQNSRVYEAFDHHLNALLAIKEIEKSRIGDPAKYFTEAQTVHRSAHPRVVPIHWAADAGGHVCLAMPLMGGGSLSDRIQLKPLQPSALMGIAQDLCEGVAHVHIAGYVHLDIKPTNVLLDAKGRAAVSDFGQALPVDYSGIADARDLAFYPSLVPPELVRDKGRVSHASDVYQIGLTLYRAANGEPYFQKQWKELQTASWADRRAAIASGEFPDKSFLPCVPLGIQQTIVRALSVDPAKRPVGARALAQELGRVVIRHDWSTEDYSADAASWRLRREGRADILVLRVGAFPAANVEIWSETDARRRRKNPACWTRNIRTERQLRKALSRAFRAAPT